MNGASTACLSLSGTTHLYQPDRIRCNEPGLGPMPPQQIQVEHEVARQATESREHKLTRLPDKARQASTVEAFSHEAYRRMQVACQVKCFWPICRYRGGQHLRNAIVVWLRQARHPQRRLVTGK